MSAGVLLLDATERSGENSSDEGERRSEIVKVRKLKRLPSYAGMSYLIGVEWPTDYVSACSGKTAAFPPCFSVPLHLPLFVP